MRRFGRWIARISAGLLVLIVIAAIGGVLWLRTSLPQIEGERQLVGLSGPVTVARDNHGIPHIKASSKLDAVRALGFLHAQDRLFQMESMRRAGRGRMAELIGSLALGLYKRMRTFGLAHLVDEDVKHLSAPVAAAFDAYAAGVNQFLETHSGALPPEFLLAPGAVEPWKPADSLLWIKMMSLRLTSDWGDELERTELATALSAEQISELFPEIDGSITLGATASPRAIRQALATTGVVEEGAGSNLWLYSGHRTDTGKPILANDPHLGFTVPGVWYLVRIETPDDIVAGATSPGFPFVVLGHNGTVAWAFTNAYGDTSDVFVERSDPTDPNHYLTPDGSAPFDERTETIQVRFGDPVVLNVRSSRYVLIISDGDASKAALVGEGEALALAHTTLLPGDTTAMALAAVQEAGSVAEAMEATRSVFAPQQNIALADITGTTGLISPALVPLRKGGTSRLPSRGWTGEHDWIGFIPFDGLPQIVNPPSGRLVNANNRLVGPDYPYDLGMATAPPMRAKAIELALDQTQPHTVAASLAVQRDLFSLAAQQLMATIDWSVIGEAAPPDLLDTMQKWDATMQGDRPEPLYFHAWMRELVRIVYADELGALFPIVNKGNIERLLPTIQHAQHWCDNTTTPTVEDGNHAMATAFTAAYQMLEEKYGGYWQAWRWDEAHVARFRHVPFGYMPVLKEIFDVVVPHDGGRYTANAGIVSFAEDTLFNQVHGAGYRAVYDLSALDQSRFIQAVGQSANIFSPYYSDLAPLWAKGETVSLGPLSGQPAHVLTLLPGGE
ncbi:MAG: penicillin acylase family protein [Alphaproteobacteria bacterium]